MIDTAELKKATCRVIAGDYSGSGIFVKEDLILTCYHVVKGNLTNDFVVHTHFGVKLEVNIKDYCTTNDLVLLQIKENGVTGPAVATLCNEAQVLGVEWATHGHPNSMEGQSIGSKLEGTLKDVVIKDHAHDVILNSGSTPISAECRGYSGSGVINKRLQVTSILRYQDNNAYCSVSVRKASSFLMKNGVQVQEDELYDFSVYEPMAFQTIANPFKDICRSQISTVKSTISPQKIASTLQKELYYPAIHDSLNVIIADLKQDVNKSESLWIGWLEFLSYVQMLRGTYIEADAINIELKDAQISKLIEQVETPISQDLNITLQFYYTDEKEYFSIARKYLLEKITEGVLENFKCHIFHSALPRFGLQTITPEDKSKIVYDIADASDAGPQIVSNTYIGVLSFEELSRKVADSRRLADATTYLKQIFLDAIR